jgi:2-oxoglutarate ferredoxin oxidoreductase subunit alpha
MLRRLNRKIDRHRERIILVDEDLQEGAKLAVFAYGSTARSASRAVKMAREEGLTVSFLAPLTLWPFPTEHLERLRGTISDMIVPEMNLGQYAHEVEWALGKDINVHRVSRIDGEPLRPQEILRKVQEVARS